MAGYVFFDDEHQKKVEGRYWNSQGIGVAIIAGITKGVDWAAYIGADQSPKEVETLAYVARYGNKLSEKDARYFFPELADLPYRH